MSTGAQELVLFGCTLQIEEVEPDHFRVRAIYRVPALTAGLTLYAESADLARLLALVEAQYHQFDRSVSWELESGGKALRLAWGLDELGHLQHGLLRMEDPAKGWLLEAALEGDQSYLPAIAMGLQLLLRHMGA